MNEPVEISLYDCRQVSELLREGWGSNPVAAVMDVLTAYNAFVSGDPVGTVRADGKGLEIAVSCGPRKWWLFNETGPYEAPRLITNDPVIPTWPVVHAPKDSER
jgi:hypothetical protein